MSETPETTPSEPPPAAEPVPSAPRPEPGAPNVPETAGDPVAAPDSDPEKSRGGMVSNLPADRRHGTLEDARGGDPLAPISEEDYPAGSPPDEPPAQDPIPEPTPAVMPPGDDESA